MVRILGRLCARLGIVFVAAEIELDVLTGRKGIAGSRHDDDFGGVLRFQFVQRLAHFAMQLRAHRIALLGAVEDDEGDAPISLEFDALESFCHPDLLVCVLLRMLAGLSAYCSPTMPSGLEPRCGELA